jgi:hypothetical protein
MPDTPPPFCSQPQAPVPVKTSTGNLYESPTEALKAVRDDYLYWTGRLTDTSLQLSFAVIAANWAAFGSVDAILTSSWAKLSIVLVVLSLGMSVVVAHWMGTLHFKRIVYAESDSDRWKQEYSVAAGKRDPWPFTSTIEQLGRVQRRFKTWLPVGAGISFLIGLLFR